MKARNGQVALYLALVLVAICFLVMMNVGSYLAVSAKNKTMNAGDAAALAVARWQGELINQIGADNVAHLKAAIEGDAEACEEIVIRQMRTCFLDPLEGLRIGNDLARENGAEQSDVMLDVLRQHVIDIRQGYEPSPEYYPEPWKGAWEEYAVKLETELAGGIWAAPDNIDFIDAAAGHMLMNRQFYNAIGGRNWCWFHFNAPDLLDSYTSYRDWGPLPVADEETRFRRRCNSEIYSLHLEMRTGSAVDFLGTNLIVQLTGATCEQVERAELLRSPMQSWFFFDEELWRNWWEISPSGEWDFPVIGEVKPEYNVRGCAAICRTQREIPNLVTDSPNRVSVWSGAAKPFGTVKPLESGEERENGAGARVTAYRRFVTPAFSDVRLVPWDSVGGADLGRPDLEILTHVRKHIPPYLQHGVAALYPGCVFCDRLRLWELEAFRQQGRVWLKFNSKKCIRPTHGGVGHGGTAHAH